MDIKEPWRHFSEEPIADVAPPEFIERSDGLRYLPIERAAIAFSICSAGQTGAQELTAQWMTGHPKVRSGSKYEELDVSISGLLLPPKDGVIGRQLVDS